MIVSQYEISVNCELPLKEVQMTREETKAIILEAIAESPLGRRVDRAEGDIVELKEESVLSERTFVS